jgi:microcompartment protein CcmL/EutN
VGDAVGVLEFGSVVRGMVATDEICKSAEVELMSAQTVCPGKYLVMVSGDVSAVQAACERGQQASTGLLDCFVSGRLHGDVLTAMRGVSKPEELESLGIVEAFSIPAAIQAADTAAKAAGVRLLEIRTSRGMGGKSFVLMTGSVGAVQAAVESVRASSDEAMLLDAIVIPRPSPEVWDRIA